MGDLPELFDLTGRVAVVTGGAGLLGVEFCRTLVEAGAQVVVADIDGEAAESVAKSMLELPKNAPGGGKKIVKKAIGVKTDITSKESVESFVQETLDRFGSLDILVNSAALDPKVVSNRDPGTGVKSEQALNSDPLAHDFEDFPLELWQQALDVNLTGMFLCCQSVGKHMVAERGGVIVNLCSIYGLVGPDQRIYHQKDGAPRYKPAYYSTSKAGVLGLTKYMATYYAGKGIRVNALTPGGIFNDQDDSFTGAYKEHTLMGRMAEKDEMNGALLFLVSDASSYMTGANLVVDGGWTAW